MLAIITALIGYATLFQKRDEVVRGQPLLSIGVEEGSDGRRLIVVANAGERAARALTIVSAALPGGRVHRDVLAKSERVEIVLPDGVADEIGVEVTCLDPAGSPMRSERRFEAVRTDAPRLVDGLDERGRGPFASRVRHGAGDIVRRGGSA